MSHRAVALLVVMLFVGFAGGLAVSGRGLLAGAGPQAAGAQAQRPDTPETSTQAPPIGGRAVPAAGAGLPDLSAIAERALQASVNISSTQQIRIRDPFYELFYGTAPPPQSRQSLGSGVIVSPDGYVLTNTHVIGNVAPRDARTDIQVTLPNGQEVPATLVGTDEVSDLAVVKIDSANLQTLPWGDSSRLRVAEWVLAVGNPFQFSGTVTLGIVSTVNRSGAQVGAYADFIQTDAAINPGNSGGALVNSRGELVGINTMIYSETGGYQGIGFAIPSNDARRIMEELRANGRVTWGSFGRIHWVTLSRSDARQSGLGDVEGVLVYRIWQDASAATAGLRAGDVVVSMNGEPVRDAAELDRAIVGSRVGSTARLEVVRDGRTLTIDVPVVSR